MLILVFVFITAVIGPLLILTAVILASRETTVRVFRTTCIVSAVTYSAVAVADIFIDRDPALFVDTTALALFYWWCYKKSGGGWGGKRNLLRLLGYKAIALRARLLTSMPKGRSPLSAQLGDSCACSY